MHAKTCKSAKSLFLPSPPPPPPLPSPPPPPTCCAVGQPKLNEGRKKCWRSRRKRPLKGESKREREGEREKICAYVTLKNSNIFFLVRTKIAKCFEERRKRSGFFSFCESFFYATPSSCLCTRRSRRRRDRLSGKEAAAASVAVVAAAEAFGDLLIGNLASDERERISFLRNRIRKEQNLTF
jgi:hypothetical protein